MLDFALYPRTILFYWRRATIGWFSSLFPDSTAEIFCPVILLTPRSDWMIFTSLSRQHCRDFIFTDAALRLDDFYLSFQTALQRFSAQFWAERWESEEHGLSTRISWWGFSLIFLLCDRSIIAKLYQKNYFKIIPRHFYLTDLLSLRLVGEVGARINVGLRLYLKPLMLAWLSAEYAIQ